MLGSEPDATLLGAVSARTTRLQVIALSRCCATRAEMFASATESVHQIGGLARLVGKAASSPALQSAIGSFVDYEATIESTHEMLQKVRQGLVDAEELLDDCEASMRASRTPGVPA